VAAPLEECGHPVRLPCEPKIRMYPRHAGVNRLLDERGSENANGEGARRSCRSCARLRARPPCRPTRKYREDFMEEWPPSSPNPTDPRDVSSPPPTWPPPPPYGQGPPPGDVPPPPGPELAPIPWEQPGVGFFAAFYDSLLLLATRPRQAFERVGVTSAIMRPLGFAVLVGWPGILASTLWDLALRQQMEAWMPWASDPRWERS